MYRPSIFFYFFVNYFIFSNYFAEYIYNVQNVLDFFYLMINHEN